MKVQDEVRAASENLPKRATFAYNANIDAVKTITGREVPPELPEEIWDLPECMARGAEEEVSIGKSTLDFLLKRFAKPVFRIGGQAGNMALCAARLGVVSLLHSASHAREQMMLLKEPNIFVADKNGFVRPAGIKRGGHPSIHVVLEFAEGDAIGKMKIPRSNRYIATYDPLNFRMKVDSDFSREAKKVMPRVGKAAVSGFQLLSTGNVGKKIGEISEQLAGWKRINPDLMLHLEFGDFQRSDVLKLAVKKILPLCDSAGFNEFEVVLAGRALGLGQVGGRAGAISMLSTVKSLDTVVLHSPKYAFAASRSIGSKELGNSLVFGAASAACMAGTGRPPTLHDLMGFSSSGRHCGKQRVRTLKLAGFSAASIRTFFVERPKSTVGLGDCFAAGCFLTLPGFN